MKRKSYKTLEEYLPYVEHDYKVKVIDYSFDKRKITYEYRNRIYEQSIYEFLKSISKQAHKDEFFDKFVEEANKIHGDRYGYKNYINYRQPLTVVDKLTGKEYPQRIKDILKGCKPKQSLTKWTFEQFVKESSKVHNNRFLYKKSDYKGIKHSFKVYDTETQKEYIVQANAHLKGSLPKELVNKNTSKYEFEIITQLEKLGYTVLHDVNFKWLGRYRIDIYLPDLKLGIEFNGTVYHHSSLEVSNKFWSNSYKDPYYHYNKTLLCLHNGVKLIHLFDFEYLSKDFDLKSLLDLYIQNDIKLVGNRRVLINPRTLEHTDELNDHLVVYQPELEFILPS